MQWQDERRLVFGVSEKWSGWFCQRCCWNRKLPESASERDGFSDRVGAEFASHDCEAFVRENWAAPSPPRGPSDRA